MAKSGGYYFLFSYNCQWLILFILSRLNARNNNFIYKRGVSHCSAIIFLKILRIFFSFKLLFFYPFNVKIFFKIKIF
jgi:hypothetical protein